MYLIPTLLLFNRLLGYDTRMGYNSIISGYSFKQKGQIVCPTATIEW
jgi:hypothetical protein